MKERNLTLVGLSEDQQRLVLVSDAGEEFTLPADARLRAALLGEHARLGQLEITMESALRPRDIQARIRAGESPESVAATAQTPLERVMTYANPVLAERAHIADRAQRASVRRSTSDGAARVLADAVAERLRARNVDPESVEWDAWRREDGRWTLVADYRSGGSARHAEFVFDAPGRFVLAEDDEARWMVGEQTSLKGPQPRPTPGPRRLSTVDDGDVLPLGMDAIEMVSGPDDPTTDLSASVEAVRTEEPGLREDAVGTGDADWIATQASDRPTPARSEDQSADGGPFEDAPGQPAAEDPEAGPLVEVGSEADATLAEAGSEQMTDPVVEGTDLHDDPDGGSDTSGQSADAAPRRSSRKSKRPSIPSWDEIMFGGGKQE